MQYINLFLTFQYNKKVSVCLCVLKYWHVDNLIKYVLLTEYELHRWPQRTQSQRLNWKKCLHFTDLWPPGELCPAHRWFPPRPHSGTDQNHLNAALTEPGWRCSGSHCNQAALHDPGRPSSPVGREGGQLMRDGNNLKWLQGTFSFCWF